MINVDTQQAAIFSAIAAWILAGKGQRRVILSKDSEGWRVDLDSEETVRGRTLQDAAAQAGTVALAAEAPT